MDDGRFDLEQFDPEWSDRLRTFLEVAQEHGVVVVLEVWDDWSITRGPGGARDPGLDLAWNGHPFNPDNNVNYRHDLMPPETRACEAPFYETIKDDDPTVLRLQERYVAHLATVAGKYPNVLFNLSDFF